MDSTKQAVRMAWSVALMMTPMAGAGEYTFVNVADTAGTLGGTLGYPAINNQGQVVFHGTLDNGTVGLFRADDDAPGVLTPIANTSDLFGLSFHKIRAAPAINDSGTVALWVEMKTTLKRRIYKGDGSGLTLIVQTDDPPFSDLSEYVSINSSGVVAFRGNVITGWTGLYVGSGGPPATLYETSEGEFTSFGEPSINDSGTVGFVGAKLGLGLGVFAGSGDGAATLADSLGEFSGFGSAASINNAGVGVLDAVHDGGLLHGVYTSVGGRLSTVAEDGGAYDIAISSVGAAINDDGTVAFRANANFIAGIFAGPDPVKDKVIQNGDALFGSTVVNFSFNRNCLNDHGDVAFRYDLANGVSGIAIAKAPFVAPEGDLNGDGEVNGADLGLLLSAWGTSEAAADINGDGTVDGEDLGLLLAGWTG
jgi:hypothetical protein